MMAEMTERMYLSAACPLASAKEAQRDSACMTRILLLSPSVHAARCTIPRGQPNTMICSINDGSHLVKALLPDLPIRIRKLSQDGGCDGGSDVDSGDEILDWLILDGNRVLHLWLDGSDDGTCFCSEDSSGAKYFCLRFGTIGSCTLASSA